MTKKTRNFVLVSGAILTVGLGTGLVASYMGLPVSLLSSAAGPDELQYVPQNAAVVAYANVRDVMNSEFRQRFRADGTAVGRTQRVRGEDRRQDRRGHRLDRRGLHPQPGRRSRPTRNVRRGAGPWPLRSRAPRVAGPRARRLGGGLQGQAAADPPGPATTRTDDADGRGLRRSRPRCPGQPRAR